MKALWLATVLGLVVVTVGCSDDTSSGGSAAGGGTASGGAGGSATASGGAGQTGGESAMGGSGGQGGAGTAVDPIAGVGAVSLIQGGYQFTEGTAWVPALGVLRFSDIPASQILELDPGTGTLGIWRSPSSNTNGNALAPNGDLIMCEHSGRRVSRSSAAVALPAPTDVATSYQGMQLNSPNDAVVRSDGTVYFTDPTYGLGNGTQEIPFQGVFRVGLDDLVTLVDDSFAQPNGIALSPDEGTLYVTDSQDGGLFRYDVAADGSTGPASLLLDNVTSDGMAVDDAGNLYLTTVNGIEVFAPNGDPWGVLPVPEQPANCAFGGADRRTLFITARTGLYSVKLNVPGLP